MAITSLSVGNLLEQLTALAHAAGQAILATAPHRLAEKTDGSPLAEADRRAHAVLREGLAHIAPALTVISEEDSNHHPPQHLTRFFLVDPLDGTREFLSGNGEFTVNLALIEEGQAILGIVAAPALGCIWRGVRGQGASLVAPGEPPRPITARLPPPPGLVALISRSHADPATEALLTRLPIQGRRAIGSSLKFCLLAQGEADFYPRLGPTMEWDTAAGQAVLEAAGGSVLTPDGEPLRYGKSGWRNGPFFAWGCRPLPLPTPPPTRALESEPQLEGGGNTSKGDSHSPCHRPWSLFRRKTIAEMPPAGDSC